jgi:tetratricopeptide (TPR) repeat protein
VNEFLRALRMAEKPRVADCAAIATLLNDLGVACKYSGRLALAGRYYRRALKLLRPRAVGRPELIATLYHNLGGVEHARGHYARALHYASHGVGLRQSCHPRDAVALAADEAALAAILVERRRFREARTLYRRALRVFRRNLGAEHYEVGAVLAGLGALEARARRWSEAELALRRGVLIIEEALGRSHPRLAAALNNLAVVYTHRGKLREATILYRRTFHIAGRHPTSAYPPPSLIRKNWGKTKADRRRTAKTSRTTTPKGPARLAVDTTGQET